MLMVPWQDSEWNSWSQHSHAISQTLEFDADPCYPFRVRNIAAVWRCRNGGESGISAIHANTQPFNK